jgi:hypothetical protein
MQDWGPLWEALSGGYTAFIEFILQTVQGMQGLQNQEGTMLKIWDAANFRRTLTALCLIGAPLFFAGAELLSPPQVDNDPNAMLANMAQYHERQMTSTLLGIGAAILFIPLVFGLIHMLSERGVVLGHLGGGLLLLGNMTSTVLGGLNLALWAMSAPGIDRAAMAAPLAQIGQSPVLGLLIFGHNIFALGMVLLGIGLWRARVAPRWAGICIALAVIVDVAGGMILGDSLAISVLSDALLIVGFGGVAWDLLSETDEQWERMVAVQTAKI